MTYLLDTSTFLWAAASPDRLSAKARRICEGASTSPRLVSAASLWEVVTKCGIGKLSIPNADTALPAWIGQLQVRVLAIEGRHAYAAYGLPLLHRDPFDRMLVAQAMVEGMTLVTNDEAIHRYGVKCIW